MLTVVGGGHLLAGQVWAASLATVAKVGPLAGLLGNPAASVVAIPFMVAAVVSGFLVGTSLPAGVKKLFHPLITCFVIADLCAVLFGAVSGLGTDAVLKGFLTKGQPRPLGQPCPSQPTHRCDRARAVWPSAHTAGSVELAARVVAP
eukprot:940369-Prorocentrum_minimum.AAC.1